MIHRIQMRRDTDRNWTEANPVLTVGEPGFEMTTGKLKIGDGLRSWTQLPYIGSGGYEKPKQATRNNCRNCGAFAFKLGACTYCGSDES